MNYAFLCPPTPGHLNPMRFLANELERRGHRTLFFEKRDTSSYEKILQTVRVFEGDMATHLTNDFFAKCAEDDFNEVVKFVVDSKTNVLIADEFCNSASAIAKYAGIKHVNISCSWPKMPISESDLNITQIPKEMASIHGHHVGPLHSMSEPIERKIIYVTMGTINNGLTWLNYLVSKATKNLELKTISCEFGMQKETLRHAALTICNAGMNTVLESLALGVPLVMIPIANDQDKIAKSVRRIEAGEIVELQDISSRNLRDVILCVLGNDKCASAAIELKNIISGYGREKLAADLIESI